MVNKQKETQVQVRFPPDVKDEMKQLAIKHKRSFNAEVIWALGAYIAQEKKEEGNMPKVAIPSDLETVIDLRVASGGTPQGQLKIVKRYIGGNIDYTVFTGDEHVAILEATTEQDAIYEGLTKIREFLKFLSLKDRGLLDTEPYCDQGE